MTQPPMTRALAAFAMLTCASLIVPVRAEADGIGDHEYSQAAVEDDDLRGWDHLEVSMGFLAGQRSYSDTSFKFEDGSTMAGVGGMVDPFNNAPFDKVQMYGLRYDLRLVVSFLRMTVGMDIPFASYGNGDGTGRYRLAGETRQVSVQKLEALDLRFGIGAELPVGTLVPFVDVLGSVHWITASMAIDDQRADFSATTFAFSSRAGVRLHVRRWFYAAVAGEVGIVGDVMWGAELSVGFAFL